MAEVVGIILVIGGALLGRLAMRRAQIGKAGGVEVALRRHPGSEPGSSRGWRLGSCRYVGDAFAWYPLAGLRTRPALVLERSELEITGRRSPSAAEQPLTPPSATVISCTDQREQVELAMSPDMLTGFLSWMQASPPGQSTGYRRAS